MDTIKINKGNTKMVAHRGVSGLERENTNPAFVAAGNRSYFGVETDVHVTRDGKFVIIHDETTERISKDRYHINVEENDYAAVQNLVLPDLDDSMTRGDIRIPLLEEYIHICRKYDKMCVLELKNTFREDDLKRLIDEVRQTGYLDHVIFISFYFDNCVNARNYLPEGTIQWLLGEEKITEEHIATMKKYRLDLDIYYKALDAETVKLLHDNGIVVNCWTCDDKEEAEALAAMGVDMITSNILE